MSSFGLKRQNQKAEVLPTACLAIDSLPFSPNKTEGWDTLQTYLKNTDDTVAFELLLARNTPAGNDWAAPSKVGTIAFAYRPEADRILVYKEPTRTWQIEVLTTGDCFFKLTGGPLPDGNPAILPVLTKYKK